eukprot:gnl/TRDRNA2_/TRDRNA2_34849_c0_seq1.p1 gnl/TRDRNA2_/TRDRNA2_34849_c0~~gnl/TRDRNA2_/TRDRNA2_34849_c0_seq1.p1  ORF type:complete len:200 (+),score=42.56 gnl/TRDRNA2_/TRDRNA2_34849_c0_seq1:72-671(+)
MTAMPNDDEFLTYSNASGMTIIAAKTPTDLENCAQAICYEPQKNTLIFSGTHGDKWNGDAFISDVVYKDGFTPKAMAEGNEFWFQDLSTLVHYFPKPANGEKDLPAERGQKAFWADFRQKEDGTLGIMRRTQDFVPMKLMNASRRGWDPTADEKLNAIADEIVKFVKQHCIQKVIFAYCYGANHDLAKKVASKLGVMMS